MNPVKRKICLITGASSGIGKALANEFANLGYHLILVSKDDKNLASAKDDITRNTGNTNIETYKVDLSLQKEIREFSDLFYSRYPKLDVLINNAGVNIPKKVITQEGIEYMFAVNHLASFLLTNLLLDKLRAAGKAQVINIVSNGEKFARWDTQNLQAEKGYNGTLHYCLTKLCNLMFSYELSRKLKGSGITSNAVHPGGVRTSIMKSYKWYTLSSIIWKLLDPSLLSAEQAAKKIITIFNSGIFLEETGKYYFKDKPGYSSPNSHDIEKSELLWQLSEKLTGL